MRVNRRIKETLSEIAKESVKLHNEPDQQLKYLRRVMGIYHSHLSEEEKVFVVKYMLELLHYRNLSIDPDNMLTISNIRIRTIFFVFVCSVMGMVIAAALFKTNTSLLYIGNLLFKFFMIFGV